MPLMCILRGHVLHLSSCEKLLGITIDSDLKFDKHISDLCNKISKKIKCIMPSHRLYVFRKT